MNEKEFLKLFGKEDKYRRIELPLLEGFSVQYHLGVKQYYINYEEFFEDGEGYGTEHACADMCIDLDMAVRLYEMHGGK